MLARANARASALTDRARARGRSISVLYQLPQYLFISIGEVTVSITGLEFAYSQTPRSLKSVITAMWYLAVGLGNVLVAVLAIASFCSRECMLFTYAGLMTGATALFMFLSIRYKYTDHLFAYRCPRTKTARDRLAAMIERVLPVLPADEVSGAESQYFTLQYRRQSAPVGAQQRAAVAGATSALASLPPAGATGGYQTMPDEADVVEPGVPASGETREDAAELERLAREVERDTNSRRFWTVS